MSVLHLIYPHASCSIAKARMTDSPKSRDRIGKADQDVAARLEEESYRT